MRFESKQIIHLGMTMFAFFLYGLACGITRDVSITVIGLPLGIASLLTLPRD